MEQPIYDLRKDSVFKTSITFFLILVNTYYGGPSGRAI